MVTRVFMVVLPLGGVVFDVQAYLHPFHLVAEDVFVIIALPEGGAGAV
jgi:hypothetical protein